MPHTPLHHSEPYLALALEEAEKAKGSASPNPAVGAVLVRNGEIISKGYHRGAGFPHAEVEAVRAAGDQAKGSSLYVTLEPCCHWGRTPPCTALVKESGIAEVIYGFQDPDSRVSGKGAQELDAAGIPCRKVPSPEIERFYEDYAWWKKTGRPFVTAKLALSLDGKVALAGGKPLRITGEELSRFTHQCRRQSDAILTTVRTLECDDPQLNVRLGSSMEARPVYVIDRQQRLTRNYRVFATAKEVVPVAGDLSAILDRIGQDGRYALWVEAGGTLFSALFHEKLINRAYLYSAPVVLGPEATSAFAAPLDLSTARAVRWREMGRDVICELEF